MYAPPTASAQVIAFPSPGERANRLTSRDWQDVTAWSFGVRRGGELVVHERERYGAADVADIISVYRRGERWASWCLARSGRVVHAWRCTDGRDVGEWPTMREALDAIGELLAP